MPRPATSPVVALLQLRKVNFPWEPPARVPAGLTATAASPSSSGRTGRILQPRHFFEIGNWRQAEGAVLGGDAVRPGRLGSRLLVALRLKGHEQRQGNQNCCGSTQPFPEPGIDGPRASVARAETTLRSFFMSSLLSNESNSKVACCSRHGPDGRPMLGRLKAVVRCSRLHVPAARSSFFTQRHSTRLMLLIAIRRGFIASGISRISSTCCRRPLP